MRSGKFLPVLLVLLFLAGGLLDTAKAQQIDANRLCMHNGAEYYLPWYDNTLPNRGGGKYFPSFAHWAAEGVTDGAVTTWPWKIRGWQWTGMMANSYGPTWIWGSFLQGSVDNPYATTMTWNYPINYFAGIADHNGPPWPIYGTQLPSSLPSSIARRWVLFPSSAGGFNAYLNIFATGTSTWSIPSTSPYYGWYFAFNTPASNMIHLPSNTSVYEFVYENLGPYGQYLTASQNEMDCTGAFGGNKGKDYFVGAVDHGYFYCYVNDCTGAWNEWGMSLFVNDAITIPVNAPGAPNWANPFAAYGFDIGSTTVTPLASSGFCKLQAMYEDYAHPGSGRALIAASPYSGPCVPFGPAGFRIPHAWDPVTNFFGGLWFIWQANVQSGYPAQVFGTTVGGHSIAVPMPPNASLFGLELKFSGFSTSGKAPTASYLVTYF